jgi:hypothetical protein
VCVCVCELKHTSRQWYIKFHNVIVLYNFIKNIIDQCIYLKVKGNKYIFLILYVDDILLTSNDLGLLHETNNFFLKTLIWRIWVKPFMSLVQRLKKKQVSKDIRIVLKSLYWIFFFLKIQNVKSCTFSSTHCQRG